MGELLYNSTDWDFDTLYRIHDACEHIATKQMGLSLYPNQIEIITSEQMLDAYSSIAMPLFYKHWSFGKHFARQDSLYKKGMANLAYEIVINSKPCISYLMEENTSTMQSLVIAHAACGHNTFFKTNYLFKQWTDAEGILGYLEFAKGYVAQCEERYGQLAVERVLDCAHSLMGQGVHRYVGKKHHSLREEEARSKSRQEYTAQTFNDLWRTLPQDRNKEVAPKNMREEQKRVMLGLPEENILYFIEKYAPRLFPWQRELVRIVRKIAQYFYPQRQTQVGNEGAAVYTHYYILNKMHETGQISDGNFLEFLQTHTNVVSQPDFNNQNFSGINPYALGFTMMKDIERYVTNPTKEDLEWFPDVAGSGDVMGVLKDVWANYRDESLISQFLSPTVMRNMRLFHAHDDVDFQEGVQIKAIHDERGFRNLRNQLSKNYDISYRDPVIEVVDVDLNQDRKLILQYNVNDNRDLVDNEAQQVLCNIANLWSYEIELRKFGMSEKGSLLRFKPADGYLEYSDG